jgi:hypothetical protein
VNSSEQVIQDGLNGIDSVDSNNAVNSFILQAGCNSKGSSDILSNNATSFTLSAAATSSTLPAAAAMSFPQPVSNSCNKGPSEAKIKCARKTGGIMLKTKRLKRRREKIAGDRVYSVSRSQNPRHNCTIRGDETQYIIPDDNPAYSSRAVTYLLEIAVARGRNKVYLTRR